MTFKSWPKLLTGDGGMHSAMEAGRIFSDGLCSESESFGFDLSSPADFCTMVHGFVNFTEYRLRFGSIN
jgi:hypothetical protein